MSITTAITLVVVVPITQTTPAMVVATTTILPLKALLVVGLTITTLPTAALQITTAMPVHPAVQVSKEEQTTKPAMI